MGTTGTPSMSSILLMSMAPPFPVISSIMLRATTMGMFISRSCMVRYMFLSMLVASTMFMIAVGLSSRTKFLETISSLEYGDME